MHDDVVGRVQALALELVGDDGDCAVRLVADDASATVLTGELAAFKIERVAIRVAGGVAEDGDAAIVFDPAHLDVVGDIAPDHVTSDAVPRGALGPLSAGVKTLDGGVADHVAAETIIERDDIGVGILDGNLAGPVARRGGGGNWRWSLGLRYDCAADSGQKRSAAQR